MTSLELARWQFGITTLYHFIFVPLTIGLAFFTAWYQTRWYRTKDEKWLRATRFWGKLMLISFALGVATGIVQEFQFGMNWSQYSRFVGDIFGAPLAMEALAAFFVESTFLGLWIFGWGRLSDRTHLITMWLVSASTILSAYFILAANSWMQHPVGYEMNEVTGKVELTSIWAVLTNNTALYAMTHTMLAALLTGGMVIARRLGLAPAPQERSQRLQELDEDRHADPDGRRPAHPRRRTLQRRPDDRTAADEDGCGGRGVRNRRRRRTLPLCHR